MVPHQSRGRGRKTGWTTTRRKGVQPFILRNLFDFSDVPYFGGPWLTKLTPTSGGFLTVSEKGQWGFTIRCVWKVSWKHQRVRIHTCLLVRLYQSLYIPVFCSWSTILFSLLVNYYLKLLIIQFFFVSCLSGLIQELL